MFKPNNLCRVKRATGTRSGRGVATYSDPVSVACSVVHLNPRVQKTSVRADSSATRGNAEERVSDARLLFPITFKPKEADKIEFAGHVLEVTGVEPAYTALGRLDHYQVDCRIEGSF